MRLNFYQTFTMSLLMTYNAVAISLPEPDHQHIQLDSCPGGGYCPPTPAPKATPVPKSSSHDDLAEGIRAKTQSTVWNEHAKSKNNPEESLKAKV